MKTRRSSLLLAPFLPTALLAAMLTGTVAPAEAAEPDASVAAQLDSLGIQYEVDADGDFKVVFDMGEGRSQLAFIISKANAFGSISVREIWSIAYRSPTDEFPASIANRFLEDSHRTTIGAWTKQDQHALFIVKVAADASAEQLADALQATLQTADAMEKQLSGSRDEF